MTPRRQRFQSTSRPRAKGGPGLMKRLNLYIGEAEFQKIVDRSTALECAPGTIAAMIIEAWCAGEPPCIFIGINERS